MKVTKIDIKKEYYDLASIDMPVYFDKNNRPIIGLSERDLPKGTLKYFCIAISDINKDINYYLVNVDDRKLFCDLVKISNESVNNLINKEIQDNFIPRNLYYKAIEHSIKVAENNIKHLTWWKRLFNCFGRRNISSNRINLWQNK